MVLQDKNDISKRIKELRLKKDEEMTLEAWGAEFGKNKSSAYKWEHGATPYKKTLELMAEKRGVEIGWILYGEFRDYVITFMKQFKSLKKHIQDKEYITNLVCALESKGKTYGDDDAIVAEILKISLNSDNKGEYFLGLYSDIQQYLHDNDIEIKELNLKSVDNVPEYRFNLINDVDRLLMCIKGKEIYHGEGNDYTVYNEFNEHYKKRETVYNEDAFLNMQAMVNYLIHHETLLQDENSDYIKMQLKETGLSYVDFMNKTLVNMARFRDKVSKIMEYYDKKRDQIVEESGNEKLQSMLTNLIK